MKRNPTSKKQPTYNVTAERRHQGVRKLRTFQNVRPVLTSEAFHAGWRFVEAQRV